MCNISNTGEGGVEGLDKFSGMYPRSVAFSIAYMQDGTEVKKIVEAGTSGCDTCSIGIYVRFSHAELTSFLTNCRSSHENQGRSAQKPTRISSEFSYCHRHMWLVMCIFPRTFLWRFITSGGRHWIERFRWWLPPTWLQLDDRIQAHGLVGVNECVPTSPVSVSESSHARSRLNRLSLRSS